MSNGRWGARASEKAGARDMAMDAYDKFDPREFERPAKPSSSDRPKPKPFDPSDFERPSKPASTEGFPYKAKDGGPGSGPQGRRSSSSTYKPSAEREMRDRMNGIQRDKDGKITHIHGKPVGETSAKDGRWGGRARDSVDTRYRSTDEYNPPFEYGRGKRVI